MPTLEPEIRRALALRTIDGALLRLKWLAAATRFEIALRRHDRAVKYAYKYGYNPSQPRVSAGDPAGGQWTNGGSNGRIRLAANDGSVGLPIDLSENRHVLEEHVRSRQYVLTRVRQFAERAKMLGDTFEGFSAGSFSSLEAANKLVSSTIGQNQARVDRVANGIVQYDAIEQRFGSPTGYEGYIRSTYSQAELRDTYGVKVVIAHDPNSSRGYRIITAFPVH